MESKITQMLRSVRKKARWARQIKNDHLRVALPLLCITVLGVWFVIFIPPFWGLDEVAHFNRAYEISKGELVIRAGKSGKAGKDIPSNLATVEYIAYQDLMDNNTAQPLSVRRDVNSSSTYPHISKLEMNPKLVTTIRTSTYAPIAYAGPVIGIVLANLLHLDIGHTVQAARAGSLLIYILCTFAVLRMVAITKFYWLFLLIMCLPVAIFQASTVSADGVINGLTMVFIALIIYLATQAAQEPRRRAPLITAIIILLIISVVKVNSIFLAVCLMALPATYFRNRMKKNAFIALATIVSLALAIAWQRLATIAESASPTLRPDGLKTDPAQQLSFLVHHPTDYLIILLRTIYHEWIQYAQNMTAFVGWNNTPVPNVIVVLILVAIVFASLYATSGGSLSRKVTRVFLMGGALYCVAIFTALFISYTPSSFFFIDGVQGRYFIPVIPLVVLGVTNEIRWSLQGFTDKRVAQMSIAVILVTLISGPICYYLALY